MGKINTYQRKQLASSVVGVAPMDTSGQIIGQTAVALGEALTKRQEALDNAQAVKSYYQFAAADSLNIAEMQKEFISNPNLDPTVFGEEYRKRSEIIAQEFKNKIPNRIHNRFDLYVEKQWGQQGVKNVAWVMDIQNRNALLGFEEMISVWNMKAGTTFSADEFLEEYKNFKEDMVPLKAITTAAGYTKAMKVAGRNSAHSHLSARIDFMNGGKPASLLLDFKNRPEYRQKLVDVLGEKEIQKVEKRAKQAMTIQGTSLADQQLMTKSPEISKIAEQLWDPVSGVGTVQVETKLRMDENQLEQLKINNVMGVFDKQITQLEEVIEMDKRLVHISGRVADTTYGDDEIVKTELLDSMRNSMSEFIGPRGAIKKRYEKEYEKTPADILAQQKRKRPLRPGELGQGLTYEDVLWPAQKYYYGPLIKPPLRFVMEKFGGVPRRIKEEREERIVASKNRSQWMNTWFQEKGKVLLAVDRKQITPQTAREMFSKFIGPMEKFSAYDEVSGLGNNWFAQAYDAADNFVRTNENMDFGEAYRGIGVTEAQIRTIRDQRDRIKNQIITRVAKRRALLGEQEPEPTWIQGTIPAVIREIAIELTPGLAGRKPGDVWTDIETNKTFEYKGIDACGNVIVKTADGLQEAIDNQ